MANLPSNTSYSSSTATPKLNVSSINATRIANLKKLLPSPQQPVEAQVQNPLGNYNLFALSQQGEPEVVNETLAGQVISPVAKTGNELVSAFNARRISEGLAPLTAKKSTTYETNLPGFTDKTKLVSLAPVPSINRDGGQYFLDPDGGDNQLVTGEYPDNPQARAVLLGGLAPNLFQVEHVIPRWAGGADTLENKMVMPTVEHEKKTRIQSVPYTAFYYSYLASKDPSTLDAQQQANLSQLTPAQLAYFRDPNSKLTRGMARSEALDWKTRSAAGITSYDDNTGLVSPQEAIDTLNQWHAVPKVTIGSVLNEIPKAINQLSGFARQGMEEGLGAFPVVGAAAKGFILGGLNALSFGYAKKVAPSFFEKPKETAPATTLDKINDWAEGIGELTGSVGGSIAAFSGMAGAVKGLGYVAGIGAKGATFAERVSTIPAVGKLVSRIGTEATVGTNFLKMKNVNTVTKELAKELSVATKTIGPVTEASIPKAMAMFTKEGKIMVDSGLLKKTTVLETTGRIAKSIGLFTLFGQLQQSDDRSAEATMKRIGIDTLFGALLGTQTQTIRGYLKTFGAVTTITAIDTGDAKEAFKQGLIMTGLHGLGYPASKKQAALEAAAKPIQEARIEAVATKVSKEYLDPFEVFHSPGEAPKNGSVTIAEFQAMTPKERYDIQFRAQRKLQNFVDSRSAVGPDGKIIKNVDWDLEDIAREQMRMNMAFRQIEKGGLSVEAKTKADIDDIRGYIKEQQRRARMDDSAPAKLVEQKVLERPDYIENGDPSPKLEMTDEMAAVIGADAPIGKGAVTGITEEISLARNANIKEVELAKAENRMGNKWIVINRPELEPQVKRAESFYTESELANGTKVKDPNPQHFLDVYAPVKNKETGKWEFLHIGRVARDARLNKSFIVERDANGNAILDSNGNLKLKDTSINADGNVGLYGDHTIVNVDKDGLGGWMDLHSLRMAYVTPGKFWSKGGTKDKPWVEFFSNPEDLSRSLGDFVNTKSMAATERDSEVIAVRAFKVKTPEEAKAVADQVAKMMPVEPSDVLLKKARTIEPNDPVSSIGDIIIEDMRSHQKGTQGQSLKDALDQRRKNSEFERLILDRSAQSESSLSIDPGVRKTIYELPIEGNKMTPEGVVAEVNETLKPKYGKEVIQKGMPKKEPAQKAAEAVSTIVSKVEKPKVSTEAPASPGATSEVAPVPVETPVEVTIAIQKPLKVAKQTYEQKVQTATTEVAKQESPVLDQTPEQQSASMNRAVPAGEMGEAQPKEIRPEAYVEWSDGFNKGVSQDIAQKMKGKEGTSEGKAMLDFSKSLKKENVVAGVREIRAKNLDEGGHIKPEPAFAEFESRFGKKFDDLGLINPFKNGKSREVLRHWFQRESQTIKRNVLIISDKGYGEKWSSKATVEADEHIASKMDDLVGWDRSERGDIIYVRNGMKNPEITRDPARAFGEISDILNKREYVILGSTGNTMDDIIALKRDKSFVKAYDANPEKYSAGELDLRTDPLTGKTYADELVSNNDAKMLRVFITDTLGVSPSTRQDQIMKRWKELNSHEIVNNHRNPDGSVPVYEHLVRESPKVSDIDGGSYLAKYIEGDGPLSWTKLQKYFKTKEEYNSAIEALRKKVLFDGVQYVNDKTFSEIESANAMKNQGRIKPTFASKLPDGTVVQKGNLTRLSPEMEKFMVESGILKEGLKDNQILTFHDNVKIGDRSGDFEYQMPATDMRLEWHGEHEPTGGFSLSNLGKLSADSVHPQLHEMYGGEIKRWQQFNKDLRKPGADLATLKKEYSDYLKGYDDDWEALRNMIKNGATTDGVDLQKSLQSLSNKIFTEHILSGRFIPGDHLYVKPDTKLTVWSPFSREKPVSRLLESGEVALTKKQWTDMGQPKEVMVIRFPTTRDTAMIKAKVLLTDPKNLGREEVVLNVYDGTVRLEFDYDGDSIKVLPIGKDGVPETIANSIESIRSEKGDILLSPLTKYDDAPITASSLIQGTFGSIQGGTEVGKTASLMRVMEDMRGSKLSTSLSPSKNGKSLFEIKSNGKLIYQQEVKSDTKTRINATPKWDDSEKFLSAQIMQEAVDSMKYKNLYDRLMEAKLDSTDLILRQVLGTDDRVLIGSFRKFLSAYQEPYITSKRGINDIGDFINDFEAYDKLKKDIEKSGGEVGHAGRIFTSIKPDSFIQDPKPYEVYPADRMGAEAVKNYAEQNGKASSYRKTLATDATVKGFTDFVSKVRYDGYMNNRKNMATKVVTGERGDLPELKDLRKDVLAEYDRIYSDLSVNQIEAINYWLLGAGKAPANDPANARNQLISTSGKSELPQAIKEFQSFVKNDLGTEMSEAEAGKYIRDYGASRTKNDAGDVWRFSEIFNRDVSPMAQAYYGSKSGVVKTQEAIRREDIVIDRELANVKSKNPNVLKLKDILKSLQEDRIVLVKGKGGNKDAKISEISNSIGLLLDRIKAFKS